MPLKLLLIIRGYIKIAIYMILSVFIIAGCQSGDVERSEQKVLIINIAEGNSAYRISNLVSAISQINQNIKIDTASNIHVINEDSIKYYSAILMINVDGTKFKSQEQVDLQRYIQAGGGLGLMNAEISDKFYWSWFDRITRQLREKDRQYFDGGRVASLDTETSVNDIINFLIGENIYNYARVKTSRAPDPKRFVKKVLDDQVNEPMDLAVLPDGKVVYIEREGAVKLYDPKRQSTKKIDHFVVNTEGNYEDGMLGIAVDPMYEQNNWIYIYYSPIDSIQKQNLSRFNLVEDSLIRSTEKIVLEVMVQRETCCHSGGAIVFDDAGNLYLSTGDNTSSKASDGYTPIDERPGRSPYDAQKSSSNTHDLRGKILRITPTADGSYTIPDGNLFPKDGSQGRPEIYLMGLRNPFRFTVDPITNYVYWGDVGPDSGRDSKLGPQSYDEYNQAKGPGFFGWPYFIGDNKAYPKYDFETGEIGRYFDPEKPINNSPNNTGNKVLPPAQKPMIWYPYGKSKEFPMLGTGSRSAMGGPIFYSNRYQKNSKVKFPDYYNGKWFIYEWARSWIMVVTMDQEYKLSKIEPFLPKMDFDKPIDIEFGPDGAMYLLEYGANYFTDNDDARLSKIEFNAENAIPVAIASANKTVGAAPLTVKFSAEESFDYDLNDSLTFKWEFNDPLNSSTDKSITEFEYTAPGNYVARLTVTDTKGETSHAVINVTVGNEKPEIIVDIKGNQSFYLDAESIDYNIKVLDKEDGSTEGGEIVAKAVGVHFNYLKEGKDLALLGPDQFDAPSAYLKGKNLIDNSDCRSCHAMNDKSIGPSYMQIAERYASDEQTITTLGYKIIEGGNGNWGHSLMAAHPQLSEGETKEMVKYILSLDEAQSPQKNFNLAGSLDFNRHDENSKEGAYLLSVTYKDKGGTSAPSLTAQKTIVLIYPKLEGENYDVIHNATKHRPQGGNLGYVNLKNSESYIRFNNIDLSSISKVEINIRTLGKGNLILHSGKEDGEILGSVRYNSLNSWKSVNMPINASSGFKNLFLTFKSDDDENNSAIDVDWLEFSK